jgi:hypothetical protein
MPGPKYYIVVVSKDHIQKGVAGSFMQANHGKSSSLKKLHKGDWAVFYSPKISYSGKEPLQAFTAIGQVKDEEPYPAQNVGRFYTIPPEYDLLSIAGNIHCAIDK